MMRARESGFITGLRCVARSPLPLIAGLLLIQAAAWSDEWSGENFPAWQAVDDDELETVRGGFLFSNGVQVDIGIQKAAFVNGVEQFRTQIDVSEGVQSRILNEANSVLQVGAGNTLNGLEMPGGSTFIQNTLDNQFLDNFTVVDVRIKNLDTLRQQPVPAFPSIQDFSVPGIAP
ncbi:MAG: hypothetical protein WBN43_18195 [Thiogranum sp.]